MTPNTPKRKIKDSVFTNLFQDKKYLLRLYKALHPEDSNVTEEDIKDVTIKHILVDAEVKVLYQEDEGNIIGQYIIFCKVYNEQILEAYAEDIKNSEARKTAEKLIRKGRMSLDEIAECIPALTFDELKEIEAEVMQLA